MFFPSLLVAFATVLTSVDLPDTELEASPDAPVEAPEAEEAPAVDPATVAALRESIEALQAWRAEAESSASSLAWEVSATTIYQVIDSDAGSSDFATGSLDIVLEAPLWDGASGVLDLEGSGGDGPDSELPTFGGWNGDAGSLQSADGLDRIHILEALISTPLFSDELSLTFGKVDLGGFFDPNAVANDETFQFLYGGFINSLAFEAPDPGPALVFSYMPAASYDAHFAVATTENSGDEPGTHPFSVLQVGAYPTYFEDLFGGGTECHVYAWQDGSRANLGGLGLSASQGFGENVNGFGRLAWQEECPTTDSAQRAWSVGCEYNALASGEDTVGAAFGSSRTHDGTLDEEQAWEAYWRHPVNSSMDASLHVISVSNPEGDSSADDGLSIGLRLQFNF